MSFVYLASPYSHPDPMVRQNRYESACRAAAFLMRRGHVVFSPIAHGHAIESLGLKEQMNQEFWMGQCLPMLSLAEKLVVLELPGYETSKGVALEVKKAHLLHIPVVDMDPI